ncbi:unnamed protein product [Brachionus calyciflorus]|uniref:Uncharacterized protein n=1 Tax=Brachionus calyciflorus TaxID=104777 RepID=A0A813LYE1_9BILA|nr:unnamed protein product [Brachionus calyciflorus]
MNIPKIRVNIDYDSNEDDTERFSQVKYLLEKYFVDEIRGKMHSDILTLEKKDLKVFVDELLYKYREARSEDKHKIKDIPEKDRDEFQIMIDSRNDFKVIEIRVGRVLNKTKISVQEYDFKISSKQETKYHKEVVDALKNIFNNDLPKIIAFFMTHSYNLIE